MSKKKAVRKKPQAHREQEGRASRRRNARMPAMILLVGVLLVLAAALIFRPGSDDPNAGKVWSPEHGHFH